MHRDQHRNIDGLALGDKTQLDPATATVAPADTAQPARSDVELITRPITKADFDYIVRVIDKWWGGPTSALAHPMFFYELGETAMVVETGGMLVGFLFGFVAPRGPTGYVHLVGIDPDFRRQQVGSKLYQAFESACRGVNCVDLKAITTRGNAGSVRFHEALGWTVEQVSNYAGPGRDRVVFRKQLID